MEVVRHFPFHWLAVYKASFDEEGLTATYANMWGETTRSIKWEKFTGDTSQGKMPLPGAKQAALLFFILAVCCLIVGGVVKADPRGPLPLVLLAFLVISLVAFFLQFIKRPYVSFYNVNGEQVFWLDPTRESDVLAYVRQKMETKTGDAVSGADR